MALTPGDMVLVDFPGSPLDNRRVEVVKFIPDFNLAPDGVEPLVGPLVIVRRSPKAEPIGLGLEHINGTTEASRRRLRDAEDEGDDTRQQELML